MKKLYLLPVKELLALPAQKRWEAFEEWVNTPPIEMKFYLDDEADYLGSPEHQARTKEARVLNAADRLDNCKRGVIPRYWTLNDLLNGYDPSEDNMYSRSDVWYCILHADEKAALKELLLKNPSNFFTASPQTAS